MLDNDFKESNENNDIQIFQFSIVNLLKNIRQIVKDRLDDLHQFESIKSLVQDIPNDELKDKIGQKIENLEDNKNNRLENIKIIPVVHYELKM